jgi:hypothetical protein
MRVALRQRPRQLDRRLHPFDSECEIVDGPPGIAVCVLDRASDSSRRGRQPDRFRGGLGFVGAAILEVNTDRQFSCVDDDPAVLDQRLPRHSRSPQHIGEPEARGGERLKAHCCKQLCGAGIPGVGDDESAGPPMQRQKQFCLFQLGPHRGFLCLRRQRTHKPVFGIRQIC